ncbi:Isoprenyl transferase 2 [Chlamydiales bacterium SCGC AG-110-P3]|nr:Isoprenyl transferase 2 [Chlamydiales bacterium SCGC AG-110-P3]
MTNSTLPRVSKYFSSDELAQITPDRVPKHIAIIMDGNRRWGRREKGEALAGHRSGADVVLDTVEAAKDLGVKTLTLYAFSTENWDRSPLEITSVMTLIENYLRVQETRMVREGVRLGTIGELSRLPESLQQQVTATKAATEHCDSINMVLALNYGSRDEITRAVRKIATAVAAGELSPDSICQSTIAERLDTAPWGDPDLLLRPGSEIRLSNYLLWQLSYSEIQPMNLYWPEFTPQHLLQAALKFHERERRYGA